MRVFPHKYGESVLLAVSGGADSLVMGELFLRDNGVEGPSVRLAVAHCNFHLRGAESDADAAFVQKWASEHGLKCHIVDFDTLAFASERGVSVEMAARELRYRWFDELCSEYGYSGVCVAHNANDNAETLILNLLRGTGIRGLCAMGETSLNPYGSSKVFRPVLAYSRAEIEAFASEHKLAFRTDSTNASSDYKRNRIRNEIFPLFEKINPSFIDTFADNISHFKDASAIVSEYVGGFGFDESGRLLIEALKSFRHWKYVLYSVLSDYGFSSAVIADLTALLGSDRIVSGKRFDSAGYLLVTTTSELILQPKDEAERHVSSETVLPPWPQGEGPAAERWEGLLRIPIRASPATPATSSLASPFATPSANAGCSASTIPCAIDRSVRKC